MGENSGNSEEKKKECTFCKLYKVGDGILFQTDYFFARFDRFPVSPGHLEIVPIRHVGSFSDLMYEEGRELPYAQKRAREVIEETDFEELYTGYAENPINEKSKEFVEKMLESEFLNKKPDSYNIGINEPAENKEDYKKHGCSAAGQTIEHLHIHIIPRFYGDVEDHLGGVRGIIPGMANYKK